MFSLFSALGDALSLVADHRYAALALLAAGAGLAARAYIPVAGGTIGKGCFAAAIGLGCFDGGYSLRAREDRSGELRAEIAARDAALAERDRQAVAGARLSIADRDRETLIGKTAGDMQFVIDHLTQENAHGPEPKNAIHQPAHPPCPVGVIGDAFIDRVRQLDAAAARGQR